MQIDTLGDSYLGNRITESKEFFVSFRYKWNFVNKLLFDFNLEKDKNELEI